MRPNSLDEFIGNRKAIELVTDEIQVSQKLGRSFPHSLILGPVGHGKTLLAELIAQEMGDGFVYINAVAIQDPIAFRWALRECTHYTTATVLIDEMHKLPSNVSAGLLSLLEHPGILCTPGQKDPATNQIVGKKGMITKEALPSNVTLMFATNHIGQVDDALVSRLLTIQLMEYTEEEKQEIARTTLERRGVDAEEGAIKEVARRCQSAREIAKVCGMVSDRLSIEDVGFAKRYDILKAFDKLNIDKYGLGPMERRYVKYIWEHGKVGIESIAAYLGVMKKDVSGRVEPLLIRKGFVIVATGGRKLTAKGAKVLGQKEVMQEVVTELK